MNRRGSRRRVCRATSYTVYGELRPAATNGQHWRSASAYCWPRRWNRPTATRLRRRGCYAFLATRCDTRRENSTWRECGKAVRFRDRLAIAIEVFKLGFVFLPGPGETNGNVLQLFSDAGILQLHVDTAGLRSRRHRECRKRLNDSSGGL